MFRMIFMSLFTIVNSQLPGSQIDLSGHGCVIDGGYQWCADLQTCIRPWETECNSLRDCSEECPPSIPCPMPELFGNDMSRCKLNQNLDNCGCQLSCPSYDCSVISCNTDGDCYENQFCRHIYTDMPMVGGRRGLQNSECVDKVGINQTCGGYVMPSMENRCLDELECVNTMGPMIADAPGKCKERCNSNENRDEYGNCIPQQTIIPSNCATYYDGCNTCQVRNGEAEICTLMYCFTTNTPYCMSYHIQYKSLQVGDICYRFCEDGSQENINRRNDCPVNTICSNALQNSEITFDSCNKDIWICESNSH